MSLSRPSECGTQRTSKIAALRGESVDGCDTMDKHMVNAQVLKTKQPARFMRKSGHCNIRRSAIQLGKRYVTDIFTTLVDLQWKHNLIIFLLVYTAAWSLFGFFWWLVAFARGDVDAHYENDSNHTYCVENVYSFATAFLFYIETETSVGYGKRAITDQCPEAILLFVIQALMGSIVDAFMVGCIFIKLSQPKNRAETLVFSDNSILTIRNGKYCLLFRVANLRNSLLIQCKIRAKFVKSHMTLEGEFIGLHQEDINVGFDTGADNLFLVTPLIICHEIDSRSPFYNMTSDDLHKDKFEIIVILEGMIESTEIINGNSKSVNQAKKWRAKYDFKYISLIGTGFWALQTKKLYLEAWHYRAPLFAVIKTETTCRLILEFFCEGVICQARTSYLNAEVRWGHRFLPVLFRNLDHFRVDHSQFHAILEVPMPALSMKQYSESISEEN